MSRREAPSISNDLLDQLLAGSDASAVFDQGGLFDTLKKALSEAAGALQNAPLPVCLSTLQAARHRRAGQDRSD